MDNGEQGLNMLRLILHGHLSLIAEVVGLICQRNLFLVNSNETFLSNAVEQVKLEENQVLARRNRKGQWGGGLLVFVVDEYFLRVTFANRMLGYRAFRPRALPRLRLVSTTRPWQY